MEKKRGKFKFHYGFVIVFGGFIIMALLHSMLQTCFSLFLVPVTEGMGIARTQFSLCTSIVAIVMMIISPKMGKVLVHKLNWVLAIPIPSVTGTRNRLKHV